MIHVRYVVDFQNDDRPTALDAQTNAVLADTCREYDIGQGGVTFEEIDPEHVAALITFPVNSELFVEGSLATDCLDDSSDETAVATRIWWRVVVEP